MPNPTHARIIAPTTLKAIKAYRALAMFKYFLRKAEDDLHLALQSMPLAQMDIYVEQTDTIDKEYGDN